MTNSNLLREGIIKLLYEEAPDTPWLTDAFYDKLISLIESEKQYSNQYCLVCAYAKERGVWDAKTGIYVCKQCRNAAQHLIDAIETLKLIRKEKQERGMDDSCDKMGEWAEMFLDSLPTISE